MKNYLFICCFLLTISCQNDKNKLEKPAFLIGNWIRLNDKPGSQTYETWNTNFTGIGYTKKGANTTFQETMSIISVNDTLYLKVEGVNETPTLFKFTQQTNTSFVCENPKNEFPKKIKYYIENKQLKAIISSDDFRIDFVFERVK
ncbi:MAG: hypothetical protein WAO74_10795 [Polaribacter sp.]|uniref:hypothetical protein n=1 Tax=Polaribacter sp. TaxID=1920175 RepID=UPI003BAF83E3